MTLTYEQVRAERVAAAKAEADHYRALAAKDDREVNPNWWVYDNEEVNLAVTQAARKVQNNPAFKDLIDVEDLETEAWIIVTTPTRNGTLLADRARTILEGDEADNFGKFQHALEMDLFNFLTPIARRHGRTVLGFEPEGALAEAKPTRLLDISGVLRGGSGIEWADDAAAVLA